MKKLLGIVVLGLLWCNTAFAGILPDASPSKQYKFAVEYLRVGDWENAAIAFKEFVDKNPKHNLAGNAQYWYAETFRVRQRYQEAAEAYSEGLTKYPKSTKAPMNLLKLGVMLIVTGEWHNGCENISNVKSQYPKAKKKVLQKSRLEYIRYQCQNSAEGPQDKYGKKVKDASTKEEEKKIAEEKKKKEEKRIAEEKAKAEEYERLEAKYRKKCKKGYFNPQGFKKGSQEYKNCILDLGKQEIAKAEEEKRQAEEKKKAEEERNKLESKLTEINPDLVPIASGSGFFVSREGYAITNAHIAAICELMEIKIDGRKHYLNVVTTDMINDLGLLKGIYKHPKHLEIDIEGPALGEEIVAMGYPLGRYTGAGVKISKGIVSALSGPGNNYSEFQHDAATAKGSSGGPVINKSGQVVGVVYGGIDKVKIFEEIEHIPEGINFAISSQTLVSFLKANKINYTKAYRDKKLDTEVIAQIGEATTVKLYCLNTKEFYKTLKKMESHTDILLDLK